ncbi:MAG: hypothetical protein R3B72_00585 [Polyangiaceae bacterium]
MSRSALGPSVAFALALLVAPSIAAADAGDEAFNAGMQALGQGRYDLACKEFERAEAEGGVNMKTRYQLGRCNQERGRAVDAYRAFADVERLAEEAGDPKRAAAARTRMGEVRPKVGLLTLDVPAKTAAMTGLVVALDGEPVGPEQFGRGFAVSPGAHVVTLTAPDRDPMELPVSEIAAGESAQVSLPELGAASAGNGSATSNRSPTTTGPDATAPEEAPTKANPVLFWTGLGFVIGGPLLAAAGVYTYVAEEQTEAGIAGMVVGGVLLAVGIPFMVVGGADPEPATAITVVPQIGPGFLGVSGSF